MMDIPPQTSDTPSQPTPYYVDGLVTLYHGDALEVLPHLSSAGCVILDPPYHMSPSTFRGKDDGAASASAAPVRLVNETLRQTERLLPDGGCAFVFCDWRRGPDLTYLITLSGLRVSTCLAWVRTRPGTGGMFRGAWDPIYVASKGTPTIKDKAAVPNVIQCEHPTDREHPYEKPAPVWRHLLSRIPATTVLDPFAGSGGSAQVAIEQGHHWVGIEADEAHCELIVKKLGQATLGFGEASA